MSQTRTKLSRKEATDLVARIRETTPKGDRLKLSHTNKTALAELLDRADGGLEESCSNLWAAKLHGALGELLEVLVDRDVTRLQDPSEDLLYTLCSITLRQIDIHRGLNSGDPCLNIGRACLGSLATLAADIANHEAEPMEEAMRLLAQLLGSTPDSKKALRAMAFAKVSQAAAAQTAAASPSSIANDEATSAACLALLGKFDVVLKASKTLSAQIGLCSFVASLGGPASSCQAVLVPHLPTGVSTLKHGRDFEARCAAMLNKYNEANATPLLDRPGMNHKPTPSPPS